jgi:hypothetical protein
MKWEVRSGKYEVRKGKFEIRKLNYEAGITNYEVSSRLLIAHGFNHGACAN